MRPLTNKNTSEIPKRVYVVPIIHVLGEGGNHNWTRYGVYSHNTGKTYTCLTLPSALDRKISDHYAMCGDLYDYDKITRTQDGHMRRVGYTYKIFIMELTMDEIRDLQRHFREGHLNDKKTDMGMIYLKLDQQLKACRKN